MKKELNVIISFLYVSSVQQVGFGTKAFKFRTLFCKQPSGSRCYNWCIQEILRACCRHVWFVDLALSHSEILNFRMWLKLKIIPQFSHNFKILPTFIFFYTKFSVKKTNVRKILKLWENCGIIVNLNHILKSKNFKVWQNYPP